MMKKFEQEIFETEKAFASLAKKEGVGTAFVTYASDDAVLNRENKLIRGKQEIEEYFSNQAWDNIRLEWEPDFISVADSGDLGYTYGKFRLEKIDEAGESKMIEGYFHTVWRRQPDGKWRYVWD